MNNPCKTLLPYIPLHSKLKALKGLLSRVNNCIPVRETVCLAAGFFLTCLGPNIALAEVGLEEVSLQLRWLHQFQFAGYYAAQEMGFYREVGLTVSMKEDSLSSVDSGIGEVLAGNANYGVTLSSVVSSRLRGNPVVVLAAIFQHSPAALIARADSGVLNLHDIPSVKSSLGFWENPEFIGMFMQEGIPFDQIEVNTTRYSFTYEDNLNKLIKGEIGVIAGYLTDLPFILEKRGISYVVIKPSRYGYDFYGDSIYTSEKELEEHPQRTERFLQASLRGWEYAMANTEEIIDVILNNYDVGKRGLTRESMRFEAEAMRQLILPGIVEMGHMNPGRWEHMANTYKEVGLAPKDASLKGFVYNPEESRLEKYSWLVKLLFWVIGVFGAVALGLFLFNQRLRSLVRKRTADLDNSCQQYLSLFEQSPISLWEEDFSEVKINIDELRKSGVEDFREYFENAPGEVARLTQLIKVVEINEATLKLYKTDRKEDLLGSPPGVNPEGPNPGFKEELISLSEGKQEFSIEISSRTVPGNPIATLVNVSVARGYEDTWSRVYVSVIDLTNFRQLEKFFKESESRLEAVLHTCSLGIITINKFGLIETVNHALGKMFGFSEEELIGQNVSKLMPEPHKSGHDGYLRKYIKTGEKKIIGIGREVMAQRNNGEIFPIDISVLETNIGGHTIFYGFIRDITDKKQVEQALQRSEEFLNATGRMAKVGGWELDAKTLEVRWTEETYRMHELPLDYRPLLEKMIGFYHLKDRPMLKKAIQRSIEYGEPYDLQLRFTTAKGKDLWIQSLCQPHIVDGKTVKLSGTFQDISENKRIQETINAVAKEVSQKIGDSFYQGLAINLANIMGADYSFIGIFKDESKESVQTLVACADGKIIENIEYDLKGTPCSCVLQNDEEDPCFHKSGIQELFPNDKLLQKMDIEGYIGKRLYYSSGETLGIMVLLFRKPVSEYLLPLSVINIFAARVSAELERKQAEDAFENARARLEMAIKGADLGLWDSNLQTRETFWSENLASMFGYEQDEFSTNVDDFTKYVHPNDLPRLKDAWKALLYGETPLYQSELRLRTKAGGWKWIQTCGKIFEWDSVGKPLRVVGIHQDIDSRKRAELAVKENETRLRLLLDALPNPIFVKDRDGRFVYINEAAAGDANKTVQEFIGFLHTELQLDPSKEQVEQFLKDDLEVIESGEIKSFSEKINLEPKGGVKYQQVTKIPFKFDQKSGICALTILTDITELRKIENDLRLSSERFRNIFEFSPVALWEENFSAVKEYIEGLRYSGVTDFREYFQKHPKAVHKCFSLVRILDVNPAAVKAFDAKTKSDLLGGVDKFLSPQNFSDFRDELVALCEGKTFFECEMLARSFTGQPCNFLTSLTLVPGCEETWSNVIIANVDIKELRLAEEKAARLGHILEESLNEIYIVDTLTYKFVQVNRGARENLQYSSEELAELTPLDVNPEYKLASFEKMLKPLLSGERERLRLSSLHIRKDGSTYPINAHLQMSTFGDAAVFVAIIEDTTEREKAQISLHENEARLSTILNTVAEGIVVFDERKQIKILNPAAEELFGYSAKEIIGRDIFALFEEEFHSKYDEIFKAYLKTRKRQLLGKPQEVSGLRKDGSVFPMEFVLSTAKMETGLTLIAVIRDITERKKIEKELENHRQNLEYTVESRTAELSLSMEKLMDANLRLQEANNMRSRFISSMSHELRTPLSAILGYADLYTKNYGPTIDEKQNDYIHNITNAGRHLLNLINGLLDLAKIDSGKMEVELDVFPPADFIEKILSIMAAKFNEKNLQVETFIDPNLTEITVDKRKCMQIMLNLLSNAFKFTPDGGRIGINILQDMESGIRVEVFDTGLGIDPEEKEKIFSEFYQISKSGGNSSEGTGIGLALTRRLVELQNGQIGVNSQTGVGSTFWFTLPQVTIFDRLLKEEKSQKNIEGSVPTGCRILLAEDSLIIRTMLLDMLNQQGHQITVAENGKEAVELADKIRPDLIFMDMRMPIMDGLEATRRIRARPENAKVPIIALTASTGIDAEEQQREAGCSGHLAKPVMTDEMLDILKRFLGNEKKL